MTRVLNQSDIVLIRSDEHEEHFFRGSAQTPPPTGADPTTNQAGHTWVTNRDPQALWPAQLSLHRRAWARAQAILVYGRPNWRTPAPWLRAKRDLPPSRCVSHQLPYGRCSTRYARSMPNFCAAARVSTKWIRLSQRSILPRRAPSSPT